MIIDYFGVRDAERGGTRKGGVEGGVQGKMSSAKEADVSKLGNPAWLKANHQARTELCV